MKDAGQQPKMFDLGMHYLNNIIHEPDIHRDYYDEVRWCFCYFNHRCKCLKHYNVNITDTGTLQFLDF